MEENTGLKVCKRDSVTKLWEILSIKFIGNRGISRQRELSQAFDSVYSSRRL